MADSESTDEVLSATRDWVERVVIGLDLCPFAKQPHAARQIRFVVSGATTEDALQDDLVEELRLLVASNTAAIETTLLIHPYVLQDFFAYNDFLDVAEAAVEALDLIGEIQVASFHPQYLFAELEADDPANYTNRSPYPMLHLLREASVERAVDSMPDTSEISRRNIERLRELGIARCRDLPRRPQVPGAQAPQR